MDSPQTLPAAAPCLPPPLPHTAHAPCLFFFCSGIEHQLDQHGVTSRRCEEESVPAAGGWRGLGTSRKKLTHTRQPRTTLPLRATGAEDAQHQWIEPRVVRRAQCGGLFAVVVLEVKAFEEGLERIRMPTDRSEVHSRVVLTSAQAEVRAGANEEPV